MYQTQYALFSRGTLRALLAASDAVCRWGMEEARRSNLAAEIEPLSTLRAVTALESEMFLGDRLLRDMDSVSMSHSIELRVPLVDTLLSDALAGLSDRDRYLPIGRKELLRRQSQRVLPADFFSRPKRGFEFPMDDWIRGPLRPMIEASLCDPSHCQAIGLRPDAIFKLWQQFLDRPGTIYWTRPWAIFALLQWCSTNRITC
jgi:asparagine synthase (glutamine-hydrolysing)